MSEEVQEEQEAPQANLAPAAEPTQSDWREMLPEDIRGNENLSKFESLEGLAKSYINAQQMIGRDKIPMPKSDEEWQDVYNRLGRPDSAEGYEFETVEVPEGFPMDEEALGQFKSVAHENGLTAKQANALQKWYFEQNAGNFETMVRAAEDEMTAAQANLRTEWGNAYDQKLATAMRAVREFGGDELVANLEESGLGNNTALVKTFAEIGAKISGDVSIEGNASEGNRTPMQLKAEIAKIQSDPSFYDSENLERPSMVKKMQNLMEELHGKDVIGEYTIGRL
jgi:hypothetical protein